MEIRSSFELTLKTKTKLQMAIVFQYPIDERAGRDGNNNNQAAAAAATHGRVNPNIASSRDANVINGNLEGGQLQLAGEPGVPAVPVNPQESFFHQLVNELFSVFQLFNGGGGGERERAQQRERGTTEIVAQIQDNQGQAGRTLLGGTSLMSLSRESSSSRLPHLPDIIQCHRSSFSIDVSFESRSSSIPSSLPQTMSSGVVNQDESSTTAAGLESAAELEESWRFELKLAYGPYAQVGRDLRRIADQLDSQLERPPIRPRSRRRSFEFQLVMSAAVPALVIFGVGISALRRYL